MGRFTWYLVWNCFFCLLYSCETQVVCMAIHWMRIRRGETIEKEIQLPNQSQQEFDSINRGKMQYQTDLNHLWLRNFFYDSFSVCVIMNQRFFKNVMWISLQVHTAFVLMICFIFFMCSFNFCCPPSCIDVWVYFMSQQYKPDSWVYCASEGPWFLNKRRQRRT